MKHSVDEIYGEGTFHEAARKEIALLPSNIEERKNIIISILMIELGRNRNR